MWDTLSYVSSRLEKATVVVAYATWAACPCRVHRVYVGLATARNKSKLVLQLRLRAWRAAIRIEYAPWQKQGMGRAPPPVLLIRGRVAKRFALTAKTVVGSRMTQNA